MIRGRRPADALAGLGQESSVGRPFGPATPRPRCRARDEPRLELAGASRLGRLERDAHQVDAGLGVRVDLVAGLGDDRHPFDALEQDRGEPVDLRGRDFSSGMEAEVDLNLQARRRAVLGDREGQRRLRAARRAAAGTLRAADVSRPLALRCSAPLSARPWIRRRFRTARALAAPSRFFAHALVPAPSLLP